MSKRIALVGTTDRLDYLEGIEPGFISRAHNCAEHLFSDFPDILLVEHGDSRNTALCLKYINNVNANCRLVTYYMGDTPPGYTIAQHIRSNDVVSLKNKDHLSFIISRETHNASHNAQQTQNIIAPDDAEVDDYIRHSVSQCIDNNNIKLSYQQLKPVFDYQQPFDFQNMNTFEVFTQLVDGSRLLMPIDFMDEAERSGLMPTIDRMAVNYAIDFLEDNPDSNIQLLVNISHMTLSDPILVGYLANRIRDARIYKGSLKLEVTKSSYSDNAFKSHLVTNSMSYVDIGLSIDRYDDLGAIEKVISSDQIKYIKFSKSLLCDVDVIPSARARLSNIITVARHYNVATIAHKIDEEHSLELAKQLGIGFVQGYLISEPELNPCVNRVDCLNGHNVINIRLRQ